MTYRTSQYQTHTAAPCLGAMLSGATDFRGKTTMFNRKTLFVCGAGTSFEAGLPLGVDLAKAIAAKMDVRFERGYHAVSDGDFDLYNAFKHVLPNSQNEYQRAAWLIRDGLGFAQSIDDFLDQHRSNAHVNTYGKAAIVKTVLEAEHESKLYFNPFEGERFKGDELSNTWLVKFMYMLGRGIPKEGVRQIFDNVSFIVFNYDRCIEYFLLHALQRLYNIGENEAAAIVDDLSIIHPYGSIGSLREVPFGTTRADYVALAKGIKTYTEQVSETAGEIAVEVARAKCVVFLGFAYHSQNLQIIRPAAAIPIVPVYGTAYKMSASDVDVASHRLLKFFSAQMSAESRQRMVKLENKLTCADLFDNYARSLTGGD
jgi:hypothetical protein